LGEKKSCIRSAKACGWGQRRRGTSRESSRLCPGEKKNHTEKAGEPRRDAPNLKEGEIGLNSTFVSANFVKIPPKGRGSREKPCVGFEEGGGGLERKELNMDSVRGKTNQGL